MTFLDIFLGQLTDVFRIGLLIALLLTAANTSAALNRWIPIALGAVFVAVLIPSTVATQTDVPLVTAIGIGILSNAAILAVMLALKAAYDRFAK